ncbi:MAG: serine/threonine-protein kinase [Candidatus Melainabacteria bacterium]|nr:serine/threonine-protein kinase [Candidatus Melainabacteria bacterium]
MPETNDLNLDRSAFPTERYEPVQLLGKGALGEVYLAKDKTLGRTVAVKCLLSVTDQQVVAFHREAKIASKLSHSHIISSLDFGTTESGRPYLALEYFPGVSLEDYIAQRGRLDEELVTKLFLIIAEALAYIHNHKVFHRDLKPSNILLNVDDSSGSVDLRIIDFGLSSIKEEFQSKTSVQGRTLVGTPLYMSPDQVSGGVYDARSEVYCLACLMFEALTGRPPYPGETALEILDQHSRAPIPVLSEVRPDLQFSSGIQRILNVCLAKNKADRFQSMDSLIDALHHKDTFDSGEDTRDQKKRLRFRWTIASGAALVVLLLGAGSLVFITMMEPPEKGTTVETPKEEYHLKLVADPIEYMNNSKNGVGLIVWGEENVGRLKDASESGKVFDAVTLRGFSVLTAKELAYVSSIKPKTLFVNHCRFEDVALMRALAKIPSLEKLSFYDCSDISPESLPLLKSITGLRSLVLDHCQIEDAHLRALSKLTQVKQFVFDGNEALTLAGIRTMARKDKPIAIWVDSGELAKLSNYEIDLLKQDTKIFLVTKSMSTIAQ